jgi:hypothetical protein
MNSSNRIILVLVIVSLTLSYAILKIEFESIDETDQNLISGYWNTLGILLLKVVLIGIGVLSIIQFIRKRQFGYLISLSIAIITTIIVIVIWQQIDAREASPVKLKAHYDGDINGLALTLRENMTYKIEDYAFFGGTTHFGNYRLKGDTIVLNKKYPLGKDRYIMGNRLLIKNGYVLIKADSTGNFSENAPFKMRIVKRN